MMSRINPAQGCLAVVFLVLSSVSTGQACDKCKSCDGQPAKCCDNKGLLDALDAFAGKWTKKLKSKKIGRDHAPQCGCEINSGCDCEPRCGCETAPKCGCEMHASHSRISTPPSKPVKSLAPQTIQNLPTPPASRPLPLKSPSSAAPLPDANVDPFQDDSSSRMRKVPAKVIRHRGPAARYGETFDPQASNRRTGHNAVVRISDETDPVTRSRIGLTTTISSRKGAAGQIDLSTQPRSLAIPQVIQASAARPIVAAPQNASADRKNSPATVPTVKPIYNNPLR